MSTLNLLYKTEYHINDKIKIVIPKLRDVLENEDLYDQLVYLLTAMPIDMMVQLEDIGVDFEEINDYELFLLMSPSLTELDTSLVFGDLDFSKFSLVLNKETEMFVLRDQESGAVIDRAIQGQIAAVLRKIHGLEKNYRRPGNKEAREYMMTQARKKIKRRAKRNEDSSIEQMIIALVNTEQFSYRFDNVLDLTIYQFNESVKQIVRKIDFDNKMHGIYAGTLDAKHISQSELNWLTHSK